MADDFFGFFDANVPKSLTPPVGYEAVHKDGYSWGRQGDRPANTSWVSVSQWNHLIAQFRGLGTAPGVDVADLQLASPLLLRDFILRATYAMLTNTGPGNFGLMSKATFDPRNVGKDAFAMDWMTEGDDKKVMTAAERTKLAGIATGATVTNATTVGAALAGVSQKAAPADGDRFSGVLSGGSLLFWTTWGNVKTALKTYFDGIYLSAARTISTSGLATGGGSLTADRTITVLKADQPAAIAGTDDTMAMTPLTTMTAINSRKLVIGPVATSGSSAFDFTNIPPWARRLTLLLSGLNASSGTAILVQVGTSSGVITTGYSASRATISGANSSSGSTATAFEIANASDGVIGTATLCLDASSNTWMQAGMAGRGTSIFGSAGSLTLAGVLDRLRVSRAGTGNFSSGSITLIIE